MASNNESDYETESEEYIRLKVDQVTKLKHEINKIKKIKKFKVKKLEKEETDKIKEIRDFINNKVEPTLKVNIDSTGNAKSVNMFSESEKYQIRQVPEVGTNMFFSIKDDKIIYLGKNEVFYSVGTKDYKNSLRINYKKKKIKNKEENKLVLSNLVNKTKKINKKKKRIKKPVSKTTSTQITFKKIDQS